MPLTRLAAKNRGPTAQSITITEPTPPTETKGKVIPPISQTVTIGESAARLSSKTRALSTQTITVGGGTLARLSAKSRTLAAQTVAIAENVARTIGVGQKNVTKTLEDTIVITAGTLARLTAKNRLLTTETITSNGGTLARLSTKGRVASDRVVIGEGQYSLYVHIPLYIYPTVWIPGSEWFQLADMMALYPDVQFILKINVNSGPDTSVNSDYTSGIATLKGQGNDKHSKILGYVYTSYGARPIADVKTDIDRWQSFYGSDINGIFLDEMESVTGDEAYYREITNYIHKDKGMEISWGNPGTTIDESYVKNGCVDVFQIGETTDYPTLTTIQNNTFNGTYTPNKFALGIHSVTSYNSTTIASFLPYAAYFFVTGDVMPTPYDTLSTYIDDLAIQSNAIPKAARIKGILRALATQTITVAGGTLARLAAKTRTRAETVTTGESLARLSSKIRALATQIVALSESIARTVSIQPKQVVRALTTETITVTTANLVRLVAKTRTRTENVVITEDLTRLSQKIRALTTQVTTVGAGIAAALKTTGAQNITRALAAETVAISESISRLTAKMRALSLQIVTIAETPTRLSGKSRALATQIVSINDIVNRTVSLAAAVVRTITQTVTIGESVSRLTTKTRVLATQITVISENIAKAAGTIRAVPAQTVTVGGGTLVRRTQKIRTFLENIYLVEIIKVFKNGLELIPPQPSDVGGSGKLTLYPRGRRLPSLKTIKYPVYRIETLRKLELRRRLRGTESVVIPAFSENIHRTVAPFVITNPVTNTVKVRFAIKADEPVSFVDMIANRPIPIQIQAKTARKEANKVKSAHVMQQKTIERYANKLNKLSKIMTLFFLHEQIADD